MPFPPVSSSSRCRSRAFCSFSKRAWLIGINLYSHVRRGQNDIREERLNHLSKIIDIQACIQSNAAGADEALMLDLFVSPFRSSNVLFVL